MAKEFQNNYVTEYVPSDLKMYERGGLIIYIDQLKYQEFIKDTDGRFQNTHIVNFDIIHKQAKVIKLPDDELKNIIPMMVEG